MKTKYNSQKLSIAFIWKKSDFLWKKALFAILFAFLPFVNYTAQIWTVSYCSGLPSITQSTTYGPMYSTATANATSRQASIYPASQLSTIVGQALTSVYFHTGTANASGMLGTPNFKVYFKEVSNADWGAGALDWATTVAGATLVFDGNPAPIIGTSGGWKQFPITVPFTYSGTQNLAVLFEYSNPSASNSISWSYEYTTPCMPSSSNATKYSNNTSGTLATSLASSNSRRPYIGVDFLVPCPWPTNVAVTNITQTTATANWVAGGSETAWEYAVVPAGSPAPTTFTATTAPTANLTSLTPNASYDFYVRANCGGTNGNSALSAAVNFKTLCGPVTSMFEDFDSYATGSIVPDCWARIVPATSPGSQTISSSSPYSGARNIYMYASTTQNPVTVVLPVFSNINAGTHWLRFRARVSSATGQLNVGYVTDPTDADTFVVLQSLSIANTTYTGLSEYTVTVPTSVPAGARLAIQNTKDAKSYYFDEVYWELAPTCFAPTGVTVSNTTSNGATVTWTAPTSGTPTGYQVYYSTSNVAPTATTVLNSTNSVTTATTTATLSGLTPSTTYYVWVRTVCGASDNSDWTQQVTTLNTACLPPDVTAAGVTVCSGTAATLTATSTTAGATFTWYDAATGGTALGTGASYTTPALTATTDYWVTASTGGSSNVGKTTIESGATTGGGLSSYINFTANSDFILQNVDIFPYSSSDGTAGTVTIELRTNTGTVINSATVNVIGHNSVANSTPQTVTLNFPVTGGQSYRLGVSAWSGVTNLYRDDTNITFPYSIPGVIDITSSSLSGYYYFFYNWMVSTQCESARTLVTATVNTDPNCSMSTVETGAEVALSVYPNPFTDVLNIADVKDVASITITDMAGRTVKTFAKATEQLHVGELRSGMYIVTLKMKDGRSKAVKAIKK